MAPNIHDHTPQLPRSHTTDLQLGYQFIVSFVSSRSIGKVKGQTPKVAKVEKHKAKTGRAQQRLLYTRRFVNVKMGVNGKKLGYNPQSE
jgi:small subunit ribosomal protein S30e